MKNLLFIFVTALIMLAGIINIFVCQPNKKEIKHDHSADLPHVVSKSTNQEVYSELEFPFHFHKVTNTEIANLIKWSLPLNLWLKNPDSVSYGRDTITWNYVAMGLGKINPRYAVEYNHPMWLTAREILQYNSYRWYQPVAIRSEAKDSMGSDPENPDLTQQELIEQKKLDSIISQEKSD